MADSIKINKLEIENVKRIKAVKIEPTKNGLTIVGGNNNQGKTSVLDSIAWALGGDRYKPSNASRDGSTIPPNLHIVMSNGLVVERKGKNSSLKVTDPNGNKGGQQLLNDFVEQLALDLPKFMESSGKEKAQTLLKIIGVGDQLIALEQQEKELYNERLYVGRTADQKVKFAKEQPYYPEAPKDLVSPSDLIKQQQEILARNGKNEEYRRNAVHMKAEYDSLNMEIANLRKMLQAPNFDFSSIGQSFKDFGSVGFLGVFQGQAWKDAFSAEYIGGVFSAIMLVVSFCLVDMFDTIGTLYGAASQANMLDEKGDPMKLDECMMCDSIGTVSGAILGTSTCTTFVESASGIAAGGRTGLTSLVTAICFAVCLFLSPVANIIPSCATAPALIFVGVLMAKNFAKVDMEDMRSAVPAFVTFLMMPLTYSISNGIGLGAITYVLITLFTGKYKKQDIVVTIIALLFIVKFVSVTM